MFKALEILILSTFVAGSVQAAELAPMTYKQAQEKLANIPQNINTVLEATPKIYDFKNENGDSSVVYIGQTFRQVLIHDLKPRFLGLERAKYSGNEDEAFKALNSIYEYKAGAIKTNSDMINAESEIKVKPKAEGGLGLPVAEGDFYIDIYAKGTTLKQKMAGVDNDLRKGELKGWALKSYNGVNFDIDADGKITPHELVRALMKVQAKNMAVPAAEKELKVVNGELGEQKITGASYTANGWELANLVQKVLHSAVSFSQSAGDYMSVDLAPGKGLTGNNDELYVAGDGSVRPFTLLQHHWDEAFGYFGAARNYLDYSDEQLKAKISFDDFIWDEDANTHKYVEANEASDEVISVQSEKNFGFSVNAGKRDLGAKDPAQKTDLSQTIIDPFLKGRHLIQEKPEGYLQYAQAYSVVALTEWEKVIAATVIHYINDTLKDLSKYGTEAYDFKKLAKHYSEMKGFALAFQFNPSSLMTDADFDTFHALVGDTPVLPQDAGVEAYKADLVKARDIVRDTYGFSKINAEKW